MKKYIFRSIFLFVFFTIPLSQAHAATLTNAQVQAILAVLSSFGADSAIITNVNTALIGGTPITPPTIFCHNFNTNLTVGSSGADVAALRQALFSSSIAPATDNDTSAFDETTASYVVAFQDKNNINPKSGYVGPLTRAKLNALYGCQNNQQTSRTTTGVSVENHIDANSYKIGDIVIWRNTVKSVPSNSKLCTTLIRSIDSHEFPFPPERSCQTIPIVNGNIDVIGILIQSDNYDLTAGQYELESRILGSSGDGEDNLSLASYISKSFTLVGSTTASTASVTDTSVSTSASSTVVQDSPATTPPTINSFYAGVSTVPAGTSPRLAWIVTPVPGISGTVCSLTGNWNGVISSRIDGPDPSSSNWVGGPIYRGQTYTLTCVSNTKGATDREKGVATNELYVQVSTTTSATPVISTQRSSTYSPQTTTPAPTSPSSSASSVVDSPFKSSVRLSHSVSGANSVNPLNEYVSLSALQNAKIPINISGWKLISGATESVSYVPKGTEVPTSGLISAFEDIILTPGTKAIIISGGSPLGASFRENKCIGYFKTFQSFYPQLPRNCPDPSDELYSFYGSNLIRDTACIVYVDKLSQCQTVLSPPSSMSSACQSFVSQHLNYSGCVNAHRNDADFLGNTWRVYLGRTSSMWRTKYEIVKLLDTNGKIIDTFSY